MSGSQQGSIEEAGGGGPVCWVVALKPEAVPIRERYRMDTEVSPDGPFRIWKNRDESHWLVVSGVGKVLASAATAWLYARAGEPTSAVWINAGIAGHRDGELGAVRRVERITDEGTGRSFLMPSAPNCGLDAASLLTVDRPVEEYPVDGSLVDMEASGFYAPASRLAGKEQIQCIKVVSDNAENHYRALTSGRIRELMKALVDQSEELLGQFSA